MVPYLNKKKLNKEALITTKRAVYFVDTKRLMKEIKITCNKKKKT
jgi:hypothetical protein